MTVTCSTPDCPNDGIGIEIPDTWDTCTCGGCGAELLPLPADAGQ
jgi:hypothetical protein